MPHNPRRWMLRESTANLHNAVDNAVGHFSSMDEYKRYLRDMSAFRLPLETRLRGAHWPDLFAQWRPTSVGAAIEADLDDLGIDRPAMSLGAAPEDEHELLGLLYVLEGSSLGAQILYRRALDLGLTDTFGARHLALQAGGAGTWRGFLDVLENAPGIDMARVVEASRVTFQQAETAFTSQNT